MNIRPTRSPLDDMDEATRKHALNLARQAWLAWSDELPDWADQLILLAMRPRKPTRIEWYAAQARESLGIEIS